MSRSVLLKGAIVVVAASMSSTQGLCGPIFMEDVLRCDGTANLPHGAGSAANCASRLPGGEDQTKPQWLPQGPAVDSREIVNRPRRSQLLLDINAGGRLASLGSDMLAYDPVAYLWQFTAEDRANTPLRESRALLGIDHVALIAWDDAGARQAALLQGSQVAPAAYAVDSVAQAPLPAVHVVPEPNSAALAALGGLLLAAGGLARARRPRR